MSGHQFLDLVRTARRTHHLRTGGEETFRQVPSQARGAARDNGCLPAQHLRPGLQFHHRQHIMLFAYRYRFNSSSQILRMIKASGTYPALWPVKGGCDGAPPLIKGEVAEASSPFPVTGSAAAD
ncbi:hypothetical protein [Streptomyces sp. CA-251251]|uniref:hypothetical protein n=1 Tax=Streptomyces sp. CA-251251 TaxID=3240063 RepID=UPI003D8B61D9